MNSGEVEAISGSLKSWKIIHVPEKLPVLPHLQPTVDVLASAIEARHANTIVRKLNHVAPLEGLRHVKRVRKICIEGKSQLFVILCLVSGSYDDSSNTPEEVKEIVTTYQLSIFNAKVSKYAATTKDEWEEQCKLWPTSFHPPTYNIDGITGFSEEESQSVFDFMKVAVNTAKSGSRVFNAAVIVDPSTNQIIGSACDQVHSENADLMNSNGKEPCGTSHLIPVPDCNIHKREEEEQDTKLLSKCNHGDARQPYEDVACLHPWGWIEQHPHSSSDSWHPLRHAAMVAVEKSAARDRQLFPLNNPDSAQEHSGVPSLLGSPVKRQKIDTDHDEKLGNTTRPYLCTGYDIYFVWEPCIMCAMAIVHQRIKRVFFAFRNPSNGALGSVHRLQGEKSLNHHYAVFQVLLPEDILETELK